MNTDILAERRFDGFTGGDTAHNTRLLTVRGEQRVKLAMGIRADRTGGTALAHDVSKAGG